MPNGQEGEKPKVGDTLALAMLENLTELNRQMAQNRKLVEELSGLVDELNGYFETLDRTMEMLSDLGKEKPKLTMHDLAKAWTEASEELMEEEEEPDGGDPLVGADR